MRYDLNTVAKKGRRRQDHLARKAQTEGYHARSVYKLREIDEKYAIFRGGISALDLGAAPGSWSQYAVGRGATVTAVDIKPLEITGPAVIQGDFTDLDVAAAISAAGPFDVVVSDAAPATTGNRIVDTGRSEALVESIVAELPRWLAEGGACVVKLFQGGGEQQLLATFREVFRTAALVRPKAVRRESFETYIVGRGYRGGGAGPR